MAPQGEEHTSNSCSIISVACGEVELKSSCEEEPGWENTQVLSGGDMDDMEDVGLHEIQSEMCCLCSMDKDSTKKIHS